MLLMFTRPYRYHLLSHCCREMLQFWKKLIFKTWLQVLPGTELVSSKPRFQLFSSMCRDAEGDSLLESPTCSTGQGLLLFCPAEKRWSHLLHRSQHLRAGAAKGICRIRANASSCTAGSAIALLS